MIPGPWRVEGSILYKGERALNDDAELVDWLAHLTGNTVTIFRGGTSVATTVLTDGKRAVGTQAADYVVERVLREKESYYGAAEVVGNVLQTAYKPLLDEEGDAVGMLYTGASPKIIDRSVSAFRRSGALAIPDRKRTPGSAAVPCTFTGSAAAYRSGRPACGAHRGGGSDGSNLCERDRGQDEIGILAGRSRTCWKACGGSWLLCRMRSAGPLKREKRSLRRAKRTLLLSRK